MSSRERRRMVDTLVSEYRDRQHTDPAVDLAAPAPASSFPVTVDRRGFVARQRPSGDVRIGSVDRRDHAGRPSSTWRALADGGRVVAVGLRTRQAAVEALDRAV